MRTKLILMLTILSYFGISTIQAHASPSNYTKEVSDYALHYNINNPYSPEQLDKLGNSICNAAKESNIGDVYFDYTLEARRKYSLSNILRFKGFLFGAAVKNYCPEYSQDLLDYIRSN